LEGVQSSRNGLKSRKTLDAYLYSPQSEYRQINLCPTPSGTHWSPCEKSHSSVAPVHWHYWSAESSNLPNRETGKLEFFDVFFGFFSCNFCSLSHSVWISASLSESVSCLRSGSSFMPLTLAISLALSTRQLSNYPQLELYSRQSKKCGAGEVKRESPQFYRSVLLLES
jgi:hypothetical protein